MEKIKVIIICLIAITMTCAFCIGLIAISGQTTNANGNYVIHNFSDTCSVELPKNIKFTDKVGDFNSQSNVLGSNVNIESKSLFGNSAVSQITYSKNAVDGSAVGANLNNSATTTVNGKTVYHRTVMNEATGESVSVIGQNKELVDYIADHVKFKEDGNNSNTKIVKEEVVNYNINVNTSTNNNKVQSQSYEAPNGPTSAYDLKARTQSPSPTVNNTVKQRDSSL